MVWENSPFLRPARQIGKFAQTETNMSALKTVDELDVKSREFYERARFKLALSLILAAVVSLIEF